MDDQKTTEMMLKEAQRDIEYRQRQAFAAQFVRSIHADFRREVDALHERAPQLNLFREWSAGTRGYTEFPEALVEQVAILESDATFGNVSFQKTVLSTRFYPASRTSTIRLVVTVHDKTGVLADSHLTILGDSVGMRAEICYANAATAAAPYDSKLISRFLFEAASQLP